MVDPEQSDLVKPRRGRPKKLDGARIPWTVYIRADHTEIINQLATDPTREKLKYNARSQLVESLLEKWIKECADKRIMWAEVHEQGDYPRIRWELYVAPGIAGAVDLLITPPTRTRVPYGARSWLVEKLLSEWLRSQRK